MTPFEAITQLKKQMSEAIIGQENLINRIVLVLLADGNMLLESVPGLAKTRAIKSLAKNLDCGLSRIQFTPDLLPSDVTGTEIYLPDGNEKFVFQKGPIFSNLILADEINRAPAKVQSSLLEAMEERQVTVAGKTHQMEKLFMVMATQNPIEQEGTYPLPEAQLDRFMFNILVKYPTFEEELSIVNETTGSISKTIENVISADEIVFFQNLVRKAPIASNVVEYAVNLSSKTRPKEPLATEDVKKYISWGAGPRASQYLIVGAKCYAALRGKYSPDIEDVKAIAKPILRHRLVRNYRADAEGYSMDRIIEELL